MAEVKNAFIKSKMNKDLDARLIPQGEYRDAVNVQVSKSEGDDVGALENVLGNVSLTEFEPSIPNLYCVGYFVNELNSTVYLFFTTNTLSNYSPSEQNFIYSYNAQTSTSLKLVQGAFLNFSTLNPIIGVNILEDFLFFTDNRNQPRKINVNLAETQPFPYYTNEDQISVAKYYPFEAPQVIKETSTPGQYETTMYDASSEYIPINNGTGGVATPPNINNPYYEQNFLGDPQFLEDKFVRFSYRFKFVDGEYSLIAPFTQPCFIPKQDGYFLQGDEQQTFASTIVSFMENKVNKIALQIPLPIKQDGDVASAAELNTLFHMSEIDIIYKESDGLALQVVETLQVSQVISSNGFFEYIYNSTKPYKTLPENEITRVYDKVPVKALGQEIISNRIVYSNFQDKHTPPSGIKYQVGANEKYTPTNANSSKTSIEYPNHSVKQNRNYQVGVVLADRYGRQSTVILSNDVNAGTGDFGADTVYLPYRTENDSIGFLGDSLKISFNQVITSTQNSVFLTPGLYDSSVNSTNYKPLGWYSYKIVVKQIEQEYYNVYSAGAMKDIPYDYDNANPPSVGNEVSPNTSFITLINDNINKVPRDLSEVGPQDKSFRSSVVLFGRVVNTGNNFSNIGNEQYLPTNNRTSFTTNVIEDLFDLFDVLQFVNPSGDVIPITSPQNAYHGFYKSDSNPFIAEFITTQTAADQFGMFNENAGGGTADFQDIENLAILETAPTVSRLDLYYETSTSGLISTLNAAIGSGSGGGNLATDTVDFDYVHNESMAPGTDISDGTFYFVNFSGTKLTGASAEIDYVIDNTGSGVDLKEQFYLDDTPGNGDFILRTASTANGSPADAYFYYGSNSLSRQYTFGFNVTDGGSTSSVTETGDLSNIDPIINNSNANPIEVSVGESVIISALNGYNGSNTSNPNTSTYTQGLSWSINTATVVGEGVFSISLDGTQVLNSNPSAAGTSTFELNLQDAGGANAISKTFTVYFGQPQVPSDFTSNIIDLNDGDGRAIWFTDNVTSLNTNLPDFGNASTASLYLDGFNAPNSLNSLNTVDVCSTGSFDAQFINQTKSTGLTQGTLYVYIQGTNSQKPLTGTTNVYTRFAIQYRANSSSSWVYLADLNGNTISGANVGGQWRYAQLSGGTVEGLFTNGGNFINAEVASNYPQPFVFGNGSKVFAFDTVGEYRIIYGNLSSNFGQFQNGAPNCSTAGQQNTEVNGRLEIGDFYYPGFNWFGDEDGVYEYRVTTSSTSCSSSFPSNATAYYAAEPFAKYVTQLYTNTSLLTPANINGTARFRRMQERGSVGVSNPEQTKDGAYTATFSSGNRTTDSTPCTF
jgi:hypothetical protein